jgi:iron complex outermembrane receptor protein
MRHKQLFIFAGADHHFVLADRQRKALSRDSIFLGLGLSVLASALAWTEVGHASTADDSPAVATEPSESQSLPDQSATVPAVVVTAERRTERLVDVPISATVIGSAEAKAAGVVNTRDLALVTPGLVGGQTGFAFLPSIRGISSTGTGAGDEANVAMYVDNVYMAASGATAFNLANIDHVEVLKGPQGTLFGRNATGGAIRVVTSDPSFTPRLESSVGIGFTKPDSRDASVYASTGLGDKLAGSLDGYYYDDNGYLKNAAPTYTADRQGSLNNYLVRGKLLYQATDRLRLIAEADYGQTKSGVELTAAIIDNLSRFRNVVGYIPALQSWEVASNQQNDDREWNYGGYLNVTYDAQAFTLNSISALRVANLALELGTDNTNLGLNRTVQTDDVRTYSEELNWASKFSGPLSLIAGAYLYYEYASNPSVSTYAAGLSPVADGVRTVVSPQALTNSFTDYLKTTSYSAFAEATYKFTDDFSVVGGARYSIDYKSARSARLVAPFTPAVRADNDWDNVSYRVAAKYKPTPDSLIYFTNSTGFKSGNINAPTYPYPNNLAQVLPETVVAYELGYKARLLQWLDLSASAFHYDYKNIQITTNNGLSAAANKVGINILQNAARGDISGADLQLDGRLDAHWSWRIGTSWLPTAKYSQFDNGIHFAPAPLGLGAVQVTSDLSGSRILRSPKATGNVGLDYRTNLAGGEFLASTNYFHASQMFLTVGEAISQPAYDILGAEIGWTDPSKHYTVSFWGRNLTDAAYFISGNVNSGGLTGVWAKPREVGIRLRAQY